MTKNELAHEVAQRADIPQSQARQIIDSLLETLSEELAAGGEVSIAGFGKFSVSRRAARVGRNPATGAPIEIQASKVARFSAARDLKQRLGRLPGDPDFRKKRRPRPR